MPTIAIGVSTDASGAVNTVASVAVSSVSSDSATDFHNVLAVARISKSEATEGPGDGTPSHGQDKSSLQIATVTFTSTATAGENTSTANYGAEGLTSSQGAALQAAAAVMAVPFASLSAPVTIGASTVDPAAGVVSGTSSLGENGAQSAATLVSALISPLLPAQPGTIATSLSTTTSQSDADAASTIAKTVVDSVTALFNGNAGDGISGSLCTEVAPTSPDPASDGGTITIQISVLQSANTDPLSVALSSSGQDYRQQAFNLMQQLYNAIQTTLGLPANPSDASSTDPVTASILRNLGLTIDANGAITLPDTNAGGQFAANIATYIGSEIPPPLDAATVAGASCEFLDGYQQIQDGYKTLALNEAANPTPGSDITFDPPADTSLLSISGIGTSDIMRTLGLDALDGVMHSIDQMLLTPDAQTRTHFVELTTKFNGHSEKRVFYSD